LQPNALAQMYEAWKVEKGKAVIYSQWWDAKSSGTELYDPDDYDAHNLLTKGCIHAVTAMYPKDTWEAVGGFDVDMVNWEDWDFQIALASKGICSLKLSLPLWTYRKTTGKRRDENYAEFERGKKAMLTKWSRFWNGTEELMACRGCPGRKVVVPRPVTKNTSGGVPQSLASPGGAVLLEYLLTGGSRTYRGPVTHTEYRFGSDASHKFKYVLGPDVQHLLSIRGTFRVAEQVAEVPMASPTKEPVLTTIGPPVREVHAQDVTQAAPDATPAPAAVVSDVVSADDLLSIRELKQMLPSWSKEYIAVLLAKEKAGENRRTAVALLQRALTNA